MAESPRFFAVRLKRRLQDCEAETTTGMRGAWASPHFSSVPWARSSPAAIIPVPQVRPEYRFQVRAQPVNCRAFPI